MGRFVFIRSQRFTLCTALPQVQTSGIHKTFVKTVKKHYTPAKPVPYEAQNSASVCIYILYNDDMQMRCAIEERAVHLQFT